MRRNHLTSLLLFFAVLSLSQFAWSQTTLQNLKGEQVSIFNDKQPDYAVLIFMLPDCPACQAYTQQLSELKKKYPRFNFIGVFAGRYSKQHEMQEFASTYHPDFLLTVDLQHSIIKKLGVTVAPQAVIIDKQYHILYSGRIDDWMYAIGKKRTIVRQHDLQQAIEEIEKGKAVTISKTTPIGCIIE